MYLATNSCLFSTVIRVILASTSLVGRKNLLKGLLGTGLFFVAGNSCFPSALLTAKVTVNETNNQK